VAVENSDISWCQPLVQGKDAFGRGDKPESLTCATRFIAGIAARRPGSASSAEFSLGKGLSSCFTTQDRKNGKRNRKRIARRWRRSGSDWKVICRRPSREPGGDSGITVCVQEARVEESTLAAPDSACERLASSLPSVTTSETLPGPPSGGA